MGGMLSLPEHEIQYEKCHKQAGKTIIIVITAR